MRKTNVSVQKIDKSLQETYCIVIAAFQVFNNLAGFLFFLKTFSLANISIKVVLSMFFLIINNGDI